MKNGYILLSIFSLLAGFSGLAEEFRLPAGVRILRQEKPDGQTWEQCGTVALTYAAARKNFDLSLRQQGWTKVKNIDYDRIQWKSLEVWSKGMEKILIQYWREEVSLTGFAWGRLKNGEKS